MRTGILSSLSGSLRLGELMSGFADTFRLLERGVGPLLELAIRLWLAEVFFVSGVLKFASWETALYLSANEYPVSWMDPVTAAYVGVSIELGGSILLAIGLMTRVAAVSMLILALVIQFSYSAFDVQLLWAAFFGWFALHGAGPLSVDHFLKRGLADTAVPLAAAGERLCNAVTAYALPLFQLALRVWIAAALVIAAGTSLLEADANYQSWLPVATIIALPPTLAALAAVALIFGLATRATAFVLILAAMALPMMNPGAGFIWQWLFLFGIFAAFGAGPIALDAVLERRLKRTFPQLEGKPAFSLEGLPRVVIVGAGFGGLACARALRQAKVRVTLIDRHNYHLFQPLLYQVATAGLSPGDIAAPVRGLFRDHFNTRVLLGTVTSIDTRNRRLFMGSMAEPFDFLVLATGASHSYFGRDEWAPYAPGLKRVEDATEVRRRMLIAFERAEACEDDSERASLLTFLIVGGGPTGVELAGAIAELARFGMDKDFRRFDPASARVILVQAAPRLLPTFPERLSHEAQRSLEKLGIEVRVGSRVEKIDEAGVTVSGQRIASRTVLWAAGVVASPAAKWLGAEADNAGRLKVGADLSVAGLPNVFAIGDTAAANAWKGQPVPGLAPAAKQAGAYVARLIRARIAGRKPPAPFRYRHLGSLATIGRKSAVADFGVIRLRGAPAWWLWGLVHIGFLVGVRNRVSVIFDWFWAYLTYRSGTRLITGAPEEQSAVASEQARAEMRARA